MSIIVVDFTPDLYWLVSQAFSNDDIVLKHIPEIKNAEEVILSELPKIVILNDDDPNIDAIQFISKMRNHVFARNTYFIVFTKDTNDDYKRNLIINGAAQVFIRSTTNPISLTHLKAILMWLMEPKEKETQFFESPCVPYECIAKFKTWGRIGWISADECLVETNLDLNPGESITVNSPLFDDLKMKEVEFICREKNKIGRYYQYANSFLGTLKSKNKDKDQKTLKSWIEANKTISKNKPVKIVFFEPTPQYRNSIVKMIKLDKRYCARGYENIEDFSEKLNYQKPNLILINRSLIQKSPGQFEVIKKYIAQSPCYIITYAFDSILSKKDFQKKYEFAMHVDRPLEMEILEPMIAKLEQKLPQEDEKKPKVIFNKHSPLSRISFECKCLISDIAKDYLQVRIPVDTVPYCSCELTSTQFAIDEIGHIHLLRTVKVKKDSRNAHGSLHKLIFVGIDPKESKSIEKVLNKIQSTFKNK